MIYTVKQFVIMSAFSVIAAAYNNGNVFSGEDALGISRGLPIIVSQQC